MIFFLESRICLGRGPDINRQITAHRFQFANKFRADVAPAALEELGPRAIRPVNSLEFSRLAAPDAELPYDDELWLAWLLRDQSPLDLTFLELGVAAPNVARVQCLGRNNLSGMDFFKSKARDDIRSRRRD